MCIPRPQEDDSVPPTGDPLGEAKTAPAVASNLNTVCIEALAAAVEIPRNAVLIAPGSRCPRKRFKAFEEADWTVRTGSLASQG